jgi:hypothetical protein
VGEKIKNVLVLVASIMVAVVPWGSALPSWEDAVSVEQTFPLLGIVGGVLLAWLGQSPIKK